MPRYSTPAKIQTINCRNCGREFMKKEYEVRALTTRNPHACTLCSVACRGAHNRNRFVIPPIGTTFNRLTVIGSSEKRSKGGKRHWLFRCACGRTSEQLASKVVSSEIKSCGCLTREAVSAANSKYEDPLDKWRNAYYCQYRGHARDKGKSFTMSFEEFKIIIHQPCAYCGRINSNSGAKRYNRKLAHNGVDRIDSSVGYETGNIVPCCQTCNIMKQQLSVAEFLEHCKLIVGHSEVPRG